MRGACCVGLFRTSGFGLWNSEFISPANGGILFDAAAPGESRGAVGGEYPQTLYQQAAEHVHAGRLAHIDAHGKIELIGERREVEHLFEAGRQDVQREQVAAGEVFEGEEDEDERGHLQHPEREHGHGVGHEELQQRRQDRRNEKAAERQPNSAGAQNTGGDRE